MIATDNLTPMKDGILALRGIEDEAIEYGWTYGEHNKHKGWLYDLRDENGHYWMIYEGGKPVTLQRFKNVDSGASPKYLWNPALEGRPHPWWYFVRDIHPWIKARSGKLIIACGEVDMLTFMAAGIENVTSLFGEKNIPRDITTFLTRLGVKRVTYFPDNDGPGMEAMEMLHKALAGSLIQFNAYRLPEGVNDINDLWVKLAFDKDKFKAAISSCKEITPETPPPTPAPPAPTGGDDDPFDDGLYTAIEQALGVTDYNSEGWSKKAVACPFGGHEHDNSQPATHWHKDKHILKCFKCGDIRLAKDVAEQLNIDWKAYTHKSTTLDKTGIESAPETAPTLPTPQIKVISSYEMLARFEQRMNGEILTDYPPLICPWQTLHEYGGFGQVWLPGKMVGILGQSGGGKTSFVECTSDKLRREGIHTIWWGSEWTPDQMADRAVQRQGGISMNQMAKLELYHYEQKHGSKRAYGQNISQGERERTLKALATMRSWPGQMYFVDKAGDVDSLLLKMGEEIDKQKQAGNLIRVAVFDYIQLLRVLSVRREMEAIHYAVNTIKAFTGIHGLIGAIASQPTKSASAIAKGNSLQQERPLDTDDANYMRSDAFNLFLTLNITKPKTGGAIPKVGTIRIGKNSSGKERDLVSFKVDLPRLSWLDERAEVKK